MNKFYNINKTSKQEIFNQIALKKRIPNYVIEKDWWVVQTLNILFNYTEIGNHIIFKGGTSLSKAWNIIERFSEDIDIAVDRSFLGSEFEGNISNTKINKLRKTTNEYIKDVLYKELKENFEQFGFKVNLKIEEPNSKDQDPSVIYIEYFSVFSENEYILPRVKIEIGCRSLKEPNKKREIISFVDEIYHDKPFSQKSILISTVLPERTLLEKIFLLHEEFQKPNEKIRVDRLSRHLYDIYKLSKTEFLEKALNNKNLYETIVNHRYKFNKISGCNYNLHQPQSINPIPIDSIKDKWEKDYNSMQTDMIYGYSPKFDELINEIIKIKNRFNSVDWIILIHTNQPL